MWMPNLNNPVVVALILLLVAVASWAFFKVFPVNTAKLASVVKTPRSEPPLVAGDITTHKFGDFEVLEIRNLLTPEECKRLQKIAEDKGMTPSEVIDYGSQNDRATKDNFRNSVQAWLPDDTDPLIRRFADYTEEITKLPRKNQEMIQIVKYDEGGQFIEHFDNCDHPDKEYCDRVNHWAGPRRATLLMYLNDDFEGGETVFPKIDLTVKPETGKAILFWTTKDGDKILPESIHKGNPVKKGNKWIATKWTHPGEWRENASGPA